jgi:hypothetical protein
MIYDPVVEEIRCFRAKHAARYGNDLVKICEALREKQKNSTRKVVKRNPLLKLDKTG